MYILYNMEGPWASNCRQVKVLATCNHACASTKRISYESSDHQFGNGNVNDDFVDTNFCLSKGFNFLLIGTFASDFEDPLVNLVMSVGPHSNDLDSGETTADEGAFDDLKDAYAVCSRSTSKASGETPSWLVSGFKMLQVTRLPMSHLIVDFARNTNSVH